ncbi:MAG: glycosyltransferase family 2 protein [Alphaproteobacteria bacterium]|nr:glycosyltransferase family 2 protein [Alphaproteobacteria bacterium]
MKKPANKKLAKPKRTKKGIKTLSIIVPVYENAGSLSLLFATLDNVEKKLATMKVAVEFIFVDDGSQDNSLSLLLAFHRKKKNVRVIKLSRNFGEMAAIKQGAMTVKGDAFVAIAADLQDPPELLVEMVSRWQQGKKYVIAVRRSRQDPWISKLLSAFYYSLLRWLVLPNFPKGGFDMALMDKIFLPFIQNSSKSFYAPILSHWLGFEPSIIYYDRAARHHGQSKWTLGKKISAFLDIMLGFSIKPIRFISVIGFLVAVASFVFGIYSIVEYFMGGQHIRGYTSVFVVMTFLFGLIIIMLGVIGEYLWRVFNETNKRPSAVVEEIFS